MRIIKGDSREELKNLIKEGIQVDSIVTDPPYAIEFMANKWDRGEIVHDVEFWKLCLEILKPGGHMLAFSATRTYHRMVCAIEDAGFEIRDSISWIYGQGFPKSLNISKAIDKMAGAERVKIKYDASQVGNFKNRDDSRPWIEKAKFQGYHLVDDNNPITEDAKQWDGWGSGLKPAFELIVLCRKPLSEKNIASNVLKHGVGGINIDGCRVGNEIRFNPSVLDNKIYGQFKGVEEFGRFALGRFPANLIHDGSGEVEEEFAKYRERKSESIKPCNTKPKYEGWENLRHESKTDLLASSGSVSRFFYSAKASKHDRLGSKHPTVKPISLMKYLCRLVTPPNGTVLDPFAGSGTTGHAAILEGFTPILIEREKEYYNDILNRIEYAQNQIHEEHIERDKQMRLFDEMDSNR